jgi:hypothetical protein
MKHLDQDNNVSDSGRLGCWGTRFTFAVMAFFGFVITIFNRVELSVAIVAMVKTGITIDYYFHHTKGDAFIMNYLYFRWKWNLRFNRNGMPNFRRRWSG